MVRQYSKLCLVADVCEWTGMDRLPTRKPHILRQYMTCRLWFGVSHRVCLVFGYQLNLQVVVLRQEAGIRCLRCGLRRQFAE